MKKIKLVASLIIGVSCDTIEESPSILPISLDFGSFTETDVAEVMSEIKK